MTKNTIKAIPILFILCIIIECVDQFVSPAPDFMKYLNVFTAAISVFALPLLIFLWDTIKNNSGAGKFGMVLLAIYLIAAILTNFVFKASISNFNSLDDYKSAMNLYSTVVKIQSSILVMINGLCYFCIIRLLCRKSADSLVEKVQVLAILSTVLYYGIKLLNVWASFDYDSFMYKMPTILESVMMYSIISFAIMQLVDDTPTLEEVASAPAPAQVGSLVNSTGFGMQQQSSMGGGLSTTPRFRNPALEQQEAMYAQANQATQATQTTQQYQQQTTYQDQNAYAGQYQQQAYQDPNAYQQQYTQQTAYQDPNAYATQTTYQEQPTMEPVMQQADQTGIQ